MIEKIISVARCSPYASGRKNWDIAVIRDRAVIATAADLVAAAAIDLAGTMRDDFRADFLSYAESFAAFRSAPVILVPNFRISPAVSMMLNPPDESLLTWERDNATKSISCVAMLILLAAESLGLAACYNTGSLIAAPELTALLSIRNGREIGAIIPIGYKGEHA